MSKVSAFTHPSEPNILPWKKCYSFREGPLLYYAHDKYILIVVAYCGLS
jgi:hypothetical protein